MNDAQRRRHDRFNRVRTFCEQLAVPLAPESRGAQALAAIIAAIQQCETLDASQSTHTREAQQGTSRRKESREQLRAQLSAISATARTIGMEHAEVRDKFRLSGSRGNDQALLASARAFLTEATPLKPLFLEYDMPANFLETLETGISDFEQAVNQQNTGAGGRTQSRAKIDEAQEQATAELEKLDTVIRNKFRSDPAMLAAWESASHLERAPRGATTENPDTQGNNPPAGA